MRPLLEFLLFDLSGFEKKNYLVLDTESNMYVQLFYQHVQNMQMEFIFK